MRPSLNALRCAQAYGSKEGTFCLCLPRAHATGLGCFAPAALECREEADRRGFR